MATYEVFIDGKFSRDHLGLIGACAQARTGALDRPGIEHRVILGNVQEYRAKVVDGKLTTWMR